MDRQRRSARVGAVSTVGVLMVSGSGAANVGGGSGVIMAAGPDFAARLRHGCCTIVAL